MSNRKSFDEGKEKQILQWNENDLKQIIAIGDAKKLNEFCSKLGEYYANNGLSTSQIRNVLNEIQTMKTYNEVRLQLLRPKLAYTAGRHARSARVIKEHFQPLIDKSIQMVNENNFNNFKNFIEAIVAYHRYHGGRE